MTQSLSVSTEMPSKISSSPESSSSGSPLPSTSSSTPSTKLPEPDLIAKLRLAARGRQSDGWSLFSSHNGVEVFQLDASPNFYKGVSTIRKSPKEVYNFLSQIENRVKWDGDVIDRAHLVKEITSPGPSRVCYMACGGHLRKGANLTDATNATNGTVKQHQLLDNSVLPRDFCFEQTCHQCDDGGYVVAVQSIIDADVPPHPSHVRGHILPSGFVVEPVWDHVVEKENRHSNNHAGGCIDNPSSEGGDDGGVGGREAPSSLVTHLVHIDVKADNGRQALCENAASLLRCFEPVRLSALRKALCVSSTSPGGGRRCRPMPTRAPRMRTEAKATNGVPHSPAPPTATTTMATVAAASAAAGSAAAAAATAAAIASATEDVLVARAEEKSVDVVRRRLVFQGSNSSRSDDPEDDGAGLYPTRRDGHATADTDSFDRTDKVFSHTDDDELSHRLSIAQHQHKAQVYGDPSSPASILTPSSSPPSPQSSSSSSPADDTDDDEDEDEDDDDDHTFLDSVGDLWTFYQTLEQQEGSNFSPMHANAIGASDNLSDGEVVEWSASGGVDAEECSSFPSPSCSSSCSSSSSPSMSPLAITASPSSSAVALRMLQEEVRGARRECGKTNARMQDLERQLHEEQRMRIRAASEQREMERLNRERLSMYLAHVRQLSACLEREERATEQRASHFQTELGDLSSNFAVLSRTMVEYLSREKEREANPTKAAASRQSTRKVLGVVAALRTPDGRSSLMRQYPLRKKQWFVGLVVVLSLLVAYPIVTVKLYRLLRQLWSWWRSARTLKRYGRALRRIRGVWGD